MSETGGIRHDGGEDDGITRRDFLDGVAITAAGLAAASAAPYLTGAEAALASGGGGGGLPRGYYPPTTTGVKGQRDEVIDAIMKIDGRPDPDRVHSTRGGPGIRLKKVYDSGEDYDCVIVGAGASGIAAAKHYRDCFGQDSKILLLDALPDFGGHSTRNEFHVGGRTFLRNGGTVNLDSIGTWDQPAGPLLDIPGEYGEPALDLLDYAGVDADTFPDFVGSAIPSSFGLRAALLFPAKEFGRDTATPNRQNATEPNTPAGWTAFLSRTPFSPAARAAIVRIQTDEDTDWIAAEHGPMSVADKIQLLTRITYRRYLQHYIGAPDQAILQYQRNSHSLLGAGVQAVSAADMWLLGQPGFEGLGLGDPTNITFPGIGRTPQMGVRDPIDPTLFWPDGNTSLLKLVLARLIPGSVLDGGAIPDQETVVRTKVDYSKLDRRGNDVRIRLNSLVVRVQPGHGRGRKGLASVDYTPVGERSWSQKGYRVHARHVIMACWNRVTAQIVEGLPREQVEGLCYARKVPLIYGRAVLKNWNAWAAAKVSSISPRGNSLFWDSTSIAANSSFGTVYGPTPVDPALPAVLNFTVVPSGHDRTPQLAAYEEGREKLLSMSSRDLERSLWDVIDRTLGPLGGDFEPRRDVAAVMFNRWNYGYAHELTSVWDPSTYGPDSEHPHVKGRRPYRNVAIANSDSASFAYTHSAIDEGYRAVRDLPR
jgi:spermidine dehydrogenase